MGIVTANAVRDVLFRVWDPIGVSHNEKLFDEYDTFVAPLLRMINAAAPTAELEQTLSRYEGELGCYTSAERRRIIAEMLRALASH